VRLAITTPIVSRNPRFDPPQWEATAGIEEIATVVQAAERLGYECATFPEHVAIPADVAKVRGGTYWSPLPTMGYVAAVTARIRLATYVIVLGYHHPLEVVKAYGTLDAVCGGRLVLGVGVGSLEEEFALLGAQFDGRGDRADESIRAIRAAWRQRDHDGWILDPCGVQEHLPIWVGGRTRRSLRRAVALADGWCPFGISVGEAGAILAKVKTPPGFEVVLAPHPSLDPKGDPAGTKARLAEYAVAGATMCTVRFVQHSLAEYLEQLEALMQL